MTEIQKNIAVANFIIDELHKDKPFVLKLGIEKRTSFFQIMNDTKINLKINHRAHGCDILIENGVADQIYHILSSYIAKHDLPESVIESLKEVS
ncbi:hypothetical protein P3S51_03920 [Acinetobacter sp. ANC 7201]|uniref:hypothetical protein n=1 Tax=Acinetobacter sp. ANC 7201 TaxID=3035288 RepID=UPI0027A26D96|nr:hypothetical protein [Acinetobacter sp. ANC 7201]WFP97491.1 hypothetical protein P3S51_03920 [Acinetobacter sp. ANC 7201]